MADPIPIELVLSGRDLTEPRLSPDGRWVGFVQRWGSRAAVSVVDLQGGLERILTTTPDPVPGRGLFGGCYDWLPDGSGVVYVAPGADPATTELWGQPLNGGPRRLTDFGRSCAAPSVAPDGGSVVVAVDDAEIWRVPLGPGGSPIRLDRGDDEFCFDPTWSPAGDRVAWQGWSPPSMPWDEACLRVLTLHGSTAGAIEVVGVPGATVQQPRFAPTGELMCVHDASGWLNIAVGADVVIAEPVEHAGPTWGMGQRSFVPSPDGRHLAFTRNEGGFGRLCVVDRTNGEVSELSDGVHGQLGWVGATIVALRSDARTPTQIVRYDMASDEPARRGVLAIGQALGWDGIELPEPELVEIDHDGQRLHARRYPAGEGRMLAWVHGGPTDQWQVEFRPRVSYWWSRGWDVLVVDPRGSTGHGRAYQRALNGRWGRVDIDDTAALIAHAHRHGWATPDSTVIVGASAGGLTVLGLLADHGAIVAAGVASYPVSDIAALADTTHRFEAHYNDTLVGPADDVARVRALSPIHRADRIAKPLLLFHGTADPVVPIAQSDALVRAIRDASGTVDYVVYDGEGHGFRKPEHQRDEYGRTAQFLTDSVQPCPS